MRKLVSMILAVLFVISLTSFSALSETDGKIRVGISWVGDFENGEPDEDTQAYIDAVTKAGGEPIYLSQITDADSARSVLSTVDCVILTGGEDIAPSYYGEEPSDMLETVNEPRDTSDYWLATVALEDNVPILATCRGFQLINVVCGGTLYQDINSEYETEIQHRDPEEVDFTYHNITVTDPDSLIAQAMETVGTTEVNSWHHQGVKDVGEGLVVTAVADDGMPEAIELADPDQFMLAVQFHPEWHVEDGNEEFLVFFTMLMEVAEMEAAAA